MEDQSYNGSLWNRRIYRLLQDFGWARIGDHDMDVVGEDHNKNGIDTIVSFDTPLKVLPQPIILEAKNYATTSFNKSILENWISTLDKKICSLKHSEPLINKFPQLSECSTLDTGLIALWFHDENKYPEYKIKVRNAQLQISLSSRSRKIGMNKIYFMDNERLMKLFALHESMVELKKSDKFEFVYSPNFTSGQPIHRSSILTIEGMFSDVIFGTTKNEKQETEAHIFYFGIIDYKSLRFLKDIYARTILWDQSIPIILHLYGVPDDFRKIEPSIKEDIFNGFHIKIKKMASNPTLPSFILNID